MRSNHRRSFPVPSSLLFIVSSPQLCLDFNPSPPSSLALAFLPPGISGVGGLWKELSHQAQVDGERATHSQRKAQLHSSQEAAAGVQRNKALFLPSGNTDSPVPRVCFAALPTDSRYNRKRQHRPGSPHLRATSHPRQDAQAWGAGAHTKCGQEKQHFSEGPSSAGRHFQGSGPSESVAGGQLRVQEVGG